MINLSTEQKEFVNQVESTKVISGKVFSNIEKLSGHYFIITKKDSCLIYDGETFPTTGKSRPKQHSSGDLCVSSFIRYASDERLIPEMPSYLYGYKEESDKLVHIANDYRRQWVLAECEFIVIEGERNFSDGTSKETFIHNYYKEVMLGERKAKTRFRKINLINKPGRAIRGNERLYNTLFKLGQELADQRGVEVKSVNAEYATLRVFVNNRKDYLNIVSRNMFRPKLNYYISKSNRTDKDILDLQSRIEQMGLRYSVNDKTISIQFKDFQLAHFAALEAIDTVKKL